MEKFVPFIAELLQVCQDGEEEKLYHVLSI